MPNPRQHCDVAKPPDTLAYPFGLASTNKQDSNRLRGCVTGLLTSQAAGDALQVGKAGVCVGVDVREVAVSFADEHV